MQMGMLKAIKDAHAQMGEYHQKLLSILLGISSHTFMKSTLETKLLYMYSTNAPSQYKI